MLDCLTGSSWFSKIGLSGSHMFTVGLRMNEKLLLRPRMTLI